VTGEIPRRALVIGLARQGSAAALALARRGVRVVGVDRDKTLDVGRLKAAGVEVHLGSEEMELPDETEVVVKSGGVPNEVPLVAAALARRLPVWSDVEVGYRILPNPILGVTGTKGKTTTTALLGEIFEAAGREAVCAGNIGYAICNLDGRVDPDTWVLCELSSFQLEHVDRFRARVGVLLNVEADHLDRHGSLEQYRAAKLRILERSDEKVVPRELGLEGIAFGPDDELPAEPRIPGRHNRANAAAATAAARAAGLGDEAIARGLRSFAGVPHRLELVRERGGVRWVNDSIATNTFAVRHGVAAYDAPVRLILGGRAKGENYGRFARELPAHVASIYLVGEAADELAAAFDAAGRAYERTGTIAGAVAAAARDAQPGDVVLLSPACASYDQYESFEQRGEDFRRRVDAL
jgi:UDP-N-acetylmuramoylalanine--D-glutamate ligase